MSMARGTLTGRLFQLAVFVLVLCTGVVMPRAALAATSVRTEFVPTTGVSLDEMSGGAPGRGTLLYYPDGAPAGQPALIVQLLTSAERDQVTAMVYDDRNGNGYVDVTRDGSEVRVLEPNAALRISTSGRYWVRDGVPNYNLQVQITQPICAMWAAGALCGGDIYLDKLQPGALAFEIRTADPEGIGVPRWDLRHLVPGFPNRGVVRGTYAERTCSTPLAPEPSASPEWPYVALAGNFEQAPGRFQPPIVVDWERAQITRFAELVAVRGQNCSYSFYSIHPIRAGEHNQLDFEAPFAFYDLSGQGQGRPNLIVRVERYTPGDPWLEPDVLAGSPFQRDVQKVRYSWRLAPGDATFDYKIDMFGMHPFEDTTPIADGSTVVDAPSYEELPGWVIERPWLVTSFIDANGYSYNTSEGIYEWSAASPGISYLLGFSAEPNPAAFRYIPLGFRGEYRMRQPGQPLLYFSPIDQRLHLKHAEAGVWSINERQMLRSANLSGGPYIDAWLLERMPEDGQSAPIVEAALYALDGQLIASGPEGVTIRSGSSADSTFELLPPTDTASWERFRATMAPLQDQERDPLELASWIHSFDGPLTSLKGAAVENLRATPDGFRFELVVGAGFTSSGAQREVFADVQPGRSVVEYANGAYRIQPASPALITGAIRGTPRQALETSGIQLALRNDGTQDVTQALVELWAAAPGSDATLAVTQTVDLLGQSSALASLAWIPPEAGEWTLTPRVHLSSDQVIALAPMVVTIDPSPGVRPATVIAVSTTPVSNWLVAGVLAVAAALAGLLFFRALPRVSKGSEYDPS